MFSLPSQHTLIEFPMQQQQPPVNRPPGPNQRRIDEQVHGPEGIPRRYNRGPVRGVESHFRPAIANNPSPVVIPQQHGLVV